MIRTIKIVLSATILLNFLSCEYLDVIPDNVATLDNAFQKRHEAEKFLFTCYSYMPELGHWRTNPAIIGGDEIWVKHVGIDQGLINQIGPFYQMMLGLQNVVDPVGNMWSNGNSSYFKAIRDCNMFLDRIEEVPDLQEYEKIRWIGEVKFLKAFYHWQLVQMYGPIPLMDENLSINISPDDAQFERQPLDECFEYIVRLIDESLEYLPDQIDNPVDELGRITKPIALSIKARILVTAASPLFNGNSDFSAMKNKAGEYLFNQQEEPGKWNKALEACREAIEACHEGGMKLYRFNPNVDIFRLHPEMQIQMDIRNAITDRWNSELIWGHSNSVPMDLQDWAMVPYNENSSLASSFYRGYFSPPLKIAKMFYTKNGVPIEEDKTLDFNEINELRRATDEDRFNIKTNYTTARLNFDREPRFYASLGFDGSIWYGSGQYNDTLAYHLEMKFGQYSTRVASSQALVTGYVPKKLVHFQNTWSAHSSSRSRTPYPWPIMRLADLYLLYAEALNEVDGPSAEVTEWVNLVRDRAGLPSIEDSWANYSTRPGEYQTKEGLRNIIHRERLIELAFEGRRFWDLRRWKKAERVMSEPIEGWTQSRSEPELYYQVTRIYDPKFRKRDYFWPIKESDLISNKSLVQNFGW